MKSKLLGHSANDLFWFILPLLLPSLLVQYNLSYSQAGGILTVYLTVTAIGSFFMGKLSDRFSPKKILSYGLILAALGLSLAGFAPSLPVFIAILSVTAIGVSTFHPVMYAIIDDHYPDNKEKVMGLYETAGTAAILLMFLINGLLLDTIGIKGVLILTSIPALIMGIYYWKSNSIPSAHSGGNGKDRSFEPAAATDILRFVLFLLSVILRIMSIAAVLNFLPTILVNFLHFNKSSASYATAFFFAGGIGGSLAAGKYSIRFNPMSVLAVGSFLIIPCLLAFTIQLPQWGYLAIIATFGFFGSGCIISQNLLMTSLGKHLGKGEVFGILMGALTLTSAFSPALFGYLIDIKGFYLAIFIFTLPLIGSIAILFHLLREKSRVPISK